MNRNMDNLDLLPDNELRQRLVQFGFPNLPVTGTTRKTLIKKLRTYMDNEKSKLRRETTNATRYSSGEESDGVAENKRRYVRTTVSSPQQQSLKTNYAMPPPASTKTKRSAFSLNSTNKISPQIRNSAIVSPMLTNDTDEESEQSMANNSYNNIRSRTTTINANPSRSYNNNSDYLDSNIRNRYPSFTSSTPSPTRRDISHTTNGHNAEDSPYLSDFTRRLLRLRGETVESPIHSNKSKLFNDREIVHHAVQPPSESSSVPLNIAFYNFIHKLDEYYGIKQTFVPCILVTALIIFFCLVGFFYLTISPDIVSNLNPKDTTYIFCKREQIVKSNCIEENNLESALILLKDIVPELQRRVVHNKCKDSTSAFLMTSRDIINYALERDINFYVTNIMEDIKNAAYLVEMNPQWKINNVDLDRNIIGLDKVKLMIESQSNAFAILNPRLPFLCLIFNKLRTFFFIVGGITLFAICFYGGRYLLKFFHNIRQSRKEQVNTLVNDIINAAMEQASKDTGNTLLVLNHLRDKLIPPLKRSELEWAWKEAIKILENTESRLQFETVNVNGEDSKAIKWIDTLTNTITQALRSTVKKWQSPAFDKTNKIKDPPTSCLKIRQMFDKYEANDSTLKIIIQDAILEKVGNECKIYDIQLDTATCCVYVRCATVSDAGIVHDEINGWWFDKRLVSIKFVRLERYLIRFPKSLTGPTCLRPSNTKKLSLSQCNTSVNDLEDDDEDDDVNDEQYSE